MYNTNMASSFGPNWRPLKYESISSYSAINQAPQCHIYALGDSLVSPLDTNEQPRVRPLFESSEFQRRVGMSSEEMVAKVRQAWNAAARNDANPFPSGPRVGKASLRTRTDHIKGWSSHVNVWVLLEILGLIHGADVFYIFHGDHNCWPISGFTCIPFSSWCSSDNHQPASLKYLIFDKSYEKPRNYPPSPSHLSLVQLALNQITYDWKRRKTLLAS